MEIVPTFNILIKRFKLEIPIKEITWLTCPKIGIIGPAGTIFFSCNKQFKRYCFITDGANSLGYTRHELIRMHNKGKKK